jgi:release factor glutamine methyltransferase
VWTIRTTLTWTQEYLAEKGEENPRLTAQWLLAAACGLSRLELYTDYERPLSPAQRETLRASIRRRIAGEPLQYILGRAAFRHLELAVRPGVLIPRPETEVLVDVVLAAVSTPAAAPAASPALADPAAPVGPVGPRILDVGTGSGCIALALLHELPDACVIATDIDPAAVDLTRQNASDLARDLGGDWQGDRATRLTVLQDDLATSLLGDSTKHHSFDVVVSNPPYIPTSELDDLPREIRDYESRQALDGGPDGLSLFRRIVEQAKVLLRPTGLLACELHEETLAHARAFCETQGLTEARIHPDLTGKPRIITAQA